jgi:hypothetical protein
MSKLRLNLLLLGWLVSLWATSAQESIRYSVLYYPYDVSQERAIARPHPDYSGWPDTRMTRDIERISRSGIQEIIVFYQPDEVRDKERLSRLRRFHELASVQKGLLVQVVVNCAGIPLAGYESFLNRLAALNLQGFSSTAQQQRKPVLMLRDAGHLKLVSHPALRMETYPWTRAFESKRVAGALVSGEHNDGGIVIPVARIDTEQWAQGKEVWLIKRRRARALIRSLKGAQELGFTRVILDSWNNYRTGSFLEPNLLDGDTVLQALRKHLGLEE